MSIDFFGEIHFSTHLDLAAAAPSFSLLIRGGHDNFTSPPAESSGEYVLGLGS